MSYAEDARKWWHKSLEEQNKAARISEWFMDRAVLNVKAKIRSGQFQSVHFEDEVRKEHERLLEGEGGKYRRSHLTAALAFAQYATTCASLAMMEGKGL